MFPIVALPFFILAGFMANVRSMGGHMFAWSYLSPFKWGFQGGVCIELFLDDRWLTYKNECWVYDQKTKTSNMKSYIDYPRCDAKQTYNFYENIENCHWLNMGIN